jgi:DNA modification methylase
MAEIIFEKNKTYNADCFDLIAVMPNECLDLVIVDPPYGLKIAKNGKLKANSKFDRGFKKDIDLFSGYKNFSREKVLYLIKK